MRKRTSSDRDTTRGREWGRKRRRREGEGEGEEEVDGNATNHRGNARNERHRKVHGISNVCKMEERGETRATAGRLGGPESRHLGEIARE